jgi:Amt family ammonium transporter
LITYIIFSFLMTSFIYPVVVHWVWGQGWLQQKGFTDFAGVACVHLVGGTAALWGAVVVGERYGKEKARNARRHSMVHGEHERTQSLNLGSEDLIKIMDHVNKDYHMAFKEFLQTQKDDFRPHNQAYVVAGTIILWVGWLFFNGGSTYTMFTVRHNGPAKVILNTLLSGSVGGLVAVFLKPFVLGTYS